MPNARRIVIPIAALAALAACGEPRAVPRDVVDGRAAFMLHMLSTGRAPASLRAALGRQRASLSLRFDRVLDAGDRAALERLGVTLRERNGEPVRVGTVYTAEAPWAVVTKLSRVPGLVRAEPAWRPAVVRPLDLSIPAIGADHAWKTAASGGGRLDGAGIIIADVDTGVDYMHPAFFFDDGGEFDWIDVDGDGKPTPGIDGIDLDGNGAANPGETLGFIDTSTQGIQDTEQQNGVFDAGLDWLFADLNGNGLRDQGPGAFGEDAPSLGEPIFVVRDANRNGRLDPGEKLAMLKTPKVRAVYSDGTVYRRGVDLMAAPFDSVGHGTGAAATAMGGQIGGRYTGAAPGAELLAINSYSAYFDYVGAYALAKDEGARVILHEYSNWIFAHMDGTTNEEATIDALADEGIVSAIPAGNLTTARKHAKLVVPAAGQGSLTVGGPGPYSGGYLSLHFMNGDPAQITVSVNQVELPRDGSEVAVGSTQAYSAGDTSPAGTHRVDVYLYDPQGAGIAGNFEVQIAWGGGAPITVHAFATDEESGWGEGFSFDRPDEHYTVTWPSNAAKGISVASFDTRYGIQGEIGGLSFFSGRGPRIDDRPNIAIAAPGGYDLLTPAAMYSELGAHPFGSYGWFGGTSGAGPHVAGAAAILQQAFSAATGQEIRDWLTGGARTDSFTGASSPNDDWGFGKLDIPGALAKAGYDGGGLEGDAEPDGSPDGADDAGTDAGPEVGDVATTTDAQPGDAGEKGDDAGDEDAGSDGGGSSPGCGCTTILI